MACVVATCETCHVKLTRYPLAQWHLKAEIRCKYALHAYGVVWFLEKKNQLGEGLVYWIFPVEITSSRMQVF